MIKSLTIITLSALVWAGAVSAQTETPTPSSTPVTGRLMTCRNTAGKLVLTHCGIVGCYAIVTLGTNPSTTYRVSRVKNADGSLSYTPRAGSKPRCSVLISALRYGTRRVTSASCAAVLKNSACNIQ